ncbi:MAG: hypothetical protein PHT02_01250 [Tissierellia bacterium]|nr:hypothetical protein [Tissierellia bacterium]
METLREYYVNNKGFGSMLTACKTARKNGFIESLSEMVELYKEVFPEKKTGAFSRRKIDHFINRYGENLFEIVLKEATNKEGHSFKVNCSDFEGNT